MKRIGSSPGSAEVGLLASTLESAGIACELRNEAISQVMPGAAFAEELWVLNDEYYSEALDLVALFKTPHLLRNLLMILLLNSTEHFWSPEKQSGRQMRCHALPSAECLKAFSVYHEYRKENHRTGMVQACGQNSF